MGLSALGAVTFPRLTPDWVVRYAVMAGPNDMSLSESPVKLTSRYMGQSIGILNVGEGTRVPDSGPTGFPGAR